MHIESYINIDLFICGSLFANQFSESSDCARSPPQSSLINSKKNFNR